MNKFTKAKIFIRDLFRPRYAIVIELTTMPYIRNDDSGFKIDSVPTPVIMKLPYKRPFFMPFNEFYNDLTYELGYQKKVIFGSKRTLMNLYGVGSTLPHNMKNAILFQPSQEKIEERRRERAEQIVSRMNYKHALSIKQEKKHGS